MNNYKIEEKTVESIQIIIDENMRLIYRLFICNSLSRPPITYSVLISLFDGSEIADEYFIYDLSTEKETAERIFRALYKNTVMPSCAEETLDALYDIMGIESI